MAALSPALLLLLRLRLLGALFVAHLLLSIEGVTARDYCLDEIVEMQCSGAGEVLLVESAKYGRMQMGRCVKSDYGYIGCGSDVTDILAGKCSGRRSCRIFNLELLFHGKKVCPSDLKSYLEANFRCAKVILPVQTGNCVNGGHVTLRPSTATSGLISSVVSYESGVGGAACPWVIEANAGQRINLTLLDFTEHSGTSSSPPPPPPAAPSSSSSSSSSSHEPHPGVDQSTRTCRELAVVEEMAALNKIVTCANQPRSTVVFASRTNRIKISLGSQRDLAHDGDGGGGRGGGGAGGGGGRMHSEPHFILKYEVYGCPSPVGLPPNTFLLTTEVEDSMRVQCNHSDEFWVVHCARNGSWIGHVGNCSTEVLAETTGFDGFSYGMSLLLILVVAVSICLIFLVSGLLCLYRSKQFQRRHPRSAKHGFIVALPTGTDVTRGSPATHDFDPSSKGSSRAAAATGGGRSQSLGRSVYCPLDPKCTGGTTASGQGEDDDHHHPPPRSLGFHSLPQEPLPSRHRAIIPVSTPLLPRSVPGLHHHLLTHHHHHPHHQQSCTCPTRPGCLMPSSAGARVTTLQTQHPTTAILDVDDCSCCDHVSPHPHPLPPPHLSTFTTFKQTTMSPENEYGTPGKPKALVNNGPSCHDPNCCSLRCTPLLAPRTPDTAHQ